MRLYGYLVCTDFTTCNSWTEWNIRLTSFVEPNMYKIFVVFFSSSILIPILLFNIRIFFPAEFNYGENIFTNWQMAWRDILSPKKNSC